MTTTISAIMAHVRNRPVPPDYVAALAAAGLTDDETGDSILKANVIRPGPLRPPSVDPDEANAVPACAVFVTPSGGLPTRRGRDGGLDQEAPTVQLMTRSPPYDFDTGHALALAVYEVVIEAPAGYLIAEVFSGPPAWLHQDDQGHHLFVCNLMLKRER